MAIHGLTGCSTMQSKITDVYPQNARSYVASNQTVLTAEQQEQYAQNYLAHYLSPWTNQQRLLSNAEILQEEQKVINNFMRAPGFAQNQQLLTKAWITNIASNMNLVSFPNHEAKAITIRLTDVRLLPVIEPSFSALKPAWDNYPFDNLQVSIIPVATPVLVLQTTLDHAWVLILAHNIIGWMPATDIAYVNSTFIEQWSTQRWLAPLHDYIPVIAKQRYRFSARLGTLYPLIAQKDDEYEILVAVADANQNAVIEHAYLSKQSSVIFPLAATTDNFINLIDSQLGQPYGWGGMYGYRDCSSTLEDIFALFGIWLPRNSKDQAMLGKVVSLKNLTDKQKQKVLLREGVPLLTLVRLPGHIMLYLGQQNGHAYVLQEAWGLHTKNWLTGKEGRSLIGQTFIAPIDYDRSIFNRQSMLARTYSLAILSVNKLE